MYFVIYKNHVHANAPSRAYKLEYFLRFKLPLQDVGGCSFSPQLCHIVLRSQVPTPPVGNTVHYGIIRDRYEKGQYRPTLIDVPMIDVHMHKFERVRGKQTTTTTILLRKAVISSCCICYTLASWWMIIGISPASITACTCC